MAEDEPVHLAINDVDDIKQLLAKLFQITRRNASATEAVEQRFNAHADAEERDRALEIAERQALKQELRELRSDLRPLIEGKRTMINIVDFGAWIGKAALVWGAVGAALYWVWSHWLQPLWQLMTK